jgi:hypothetical protein
MADAFLSHHLIELLKGVDERVYFRVINLDEEALLCDTVWDVPLL